MCSFDRCLLIFVETSEYPLYNPDSTILENRQIEIQMNELMYLMSCIHLHMLAIT